jgi:hypothetical protein
MATPFWQDAVDAHLIFSHIPLTKLRAMQTARNEDQLCGPPSFTEKKR